MAENEPPTKPSMKSCWIRSDLSPATLEFRDIAIPRPAEGEVIIKVHASSINRGELLAAGSVKQGGGDAAGIVHETGEGVTDLRVGDKVFGRVTGGWAEYATARADQLMPLGNRLSWAQAAAVGVAFLAAYELIYPPYGRLVAGETLLVAGASSGVGVAAVQMGKALGARIIGTSSSDAKLEKLMGYGLDYGVRTHGPDFSGMVKEFTHGRGAELALNLIGGSVFPGLLRSLAPRGRLGIAGYVDGVLAAEIDLALLHANRLEIFGISNAKMTAAERADVMRRFRKDLLPLLDSGAIVPAVDQIFSFGELPAARAHVESGAHVGKVIIAMEN